MQNIQLSDHFTYKKLILFTLPSILMMIFTSIYGVVDGFFVSNFSGKTSFAAINLIMPFTMILGGMGFMIGTGGTALVAKVLGEGKEELANRYFSMMIYLTLGMGAVLSVVGIFLLEEVAIFFGATKDMLQDCILYGRIVIFFTTAFMLQNVFQSFLIVAQKASLGLKITILAGIVNMVLDAFLIGACHLGVVGAALATGLSQCVGGILPLIYFIRKNDSLLQLTKTKLEIRPVLKACGNGTSELMGNISSSIISIIFNFQLLRYIRENGVSAYGVLMYVQFIFMAIFIGYAVGSAPIVGYHYGANHPSELKSLLKKSTCLTCGTGIGLATLAYILALPLAKIFVGYDIELLNLTVHAFQIFSCAFIFAGFNIFVSSFFTALNNGTISATISFFRTLVCQMISVWLLPIILGVDGIWWAMAIAEIFANVISVIFLFLKRKKYQYM